MPTTKNTEQVKEDYEQEILIARIKNDLLTEATLRFRLHELEYPTEPFLLDMPRQSGKTRFMNHLHQLYKGRILCVSAYAATPLPGSTHHYVFLDIVHRPKTLINTIRGRTLEVDYVFYDDFNAIYEFEELDKLVKSRCTQPFKTIKVGTEVNMTIKDIFG